MDISILYQDEHLLVCLKPRGVISQTDSRGTPAMPERLAEQVGKPVYPVHRLDAEVSGVMVYAVSKKAAAGLSAMVADHEKFCKVYLAITEGVPTQPSGEWEDLLFHDRARNKTYVVDRVRNGVRSAKLAYEVLAEEQGRALVRVRLYTGRSHQIRVQFASRGLPLAGDKKYGAKLSGPIALFSHSLAFSHPVTHAPLTFTAPPPEDGLWQNLQI